MNLDALGLSLPHDWTATVLCAIGGTAMMLAWSPVADAIASRVFARPPTLGAFRALKKSFAHLLAGIAVAWVLGGFIEELVFRGGVLRGVEAILASSSPAPVATGSAILIAAVGAGLFHVYQGARAVLIITQLSVVLGVLYVLSGHNLWANILAHGAFDTIAFVRFATGASKYARMDG